MKLLHYFQTATAVAALLLYASTTQASMVFQSVNASATPANFFWSLNDIGWYWTPSTDVVLEGIQTKLATASNINNNFTFTTTLYSDRPANGGTAIDSFTWNGTNFVDGSWLGGTFSSPLALTGGVTYFVGMSGWSQALGSLGPSSGAGVNWVNPVDSGLYENLGAGSSYATTPATQHSGLFGVQLSPNQLGSTDQAVLRFIAASPAQEVPEPASLSIFAVLTGAGCWYSRTRRRQQLTFI